jgi:hypothetical protein
VKERKSYANDERYIQMMPGTGFYGVTAEDNGEAIIEPVVCFALIERYEKKHDEYETSIEPMGWADTYMDSMVGYGNFVGIFTEEEIKEYKASQDSRIHHCIKDHLESVARVKAFKAKEATQ